jgi:hypothetical protein
LIDYYFYFRGISKEQVCVLVRRDRNNNTISKAACVGHIEKTQVEKVIGNLISEDTIICTDGLSGYLAWFKLLENIEFEATKSNLRDMIIFACLFPVEETYESFRKSNFTLHKI